MRILLISPGSVGDVLPFIALGLEFKRRGHQSTILAYEQYENDVRGAGLDFHALFTQEEFEKIQSHPDLFHPVKGVRVVYRQMFLPWTPKVYKYIAEQYVPGQTCVIASLAAFGARVAQDKLGVPTVTIHVQPVFLRSIYETPVYAGLPTG